MVKRIWLLSALLLAIPAWPQAANAGGASAGETNSSQMLMPPPVSAVGLPAETGGEERTNYFRGSLAFNGGYVNNLYAGGGTSTINDALYLVQPGISVDHSTDRSHETLTYSPSFTFYDPNSTLNTVDQTGTAAFRYRLSPHVNFVAGDTGTKTSSTWNQPLSSGPVSGGLPVVSPGIVVPFANQISNSGFGELTWQFSRNDMLGFDGISTLLDFTDNSEAQDLYNSASESGSAFYTHRMTAKQYIGGAYEYSRIASTSASVSTIPEADLRADNLLGFYTAYLKPTLTLSFGGGSQHYELTQSGVASVKAWAPTAIGSLGWQGLHTSFALSASHLVTEGEGIIGAYKTDAAGVSGRWQPSRNWLMSLSGNYTDLTTAAKSFAGSLPGGHTLSGGASVGRQIGQNLSFVIQYQRLHQDYSGIRALSYDPNSSFESGSIVYHFSRPLGR